MPTITLEDLTIAYRTDGRVVRPIEGLVHRIEDGSITLLLGPSGCGKTTLLSALGGLLRPESGHAYVGVHDLVTATDDQRREHRRRRVGFVFQAFNLIPSLDARDNVAAPLIAQGVPRGVARDRAEHALAEVGLIDHVRARPGRLSGGQQQRVAVARGLVHDPEILLADEPTANLDYVQAQSVIQLLRGLARPGRVVVVSTHDDRLLPVADDVIDLTPALDGAPVDPSGERSLRPGEVLFGEGDRSTHVYVVEEGEIEVYRDGPDGEVPISTYTAGQYFGELGPMLGQPRTATARARTPARVAAMTLPEFRVRSRRVAPD